MSTAIRFVDTTVRDGNLSLWALNMRTGMMLAALPDLDEAGFEAMEFFVPGSQIKKMAQHLGEDPFQWLRRAARLAAPRILWSRMAVNSGTPEAHTVRLRYPTFRHGHIDGPLRH